MEVRLTSPRVETSCTACGGGLRVPLFDEAAESAVNAACRTRHSPFASTAREKPGPHLQPNAESRMPPADTISVAAAALAVERRRCT